MVLKALKIICGIKKVGSTLFESYFFSKGAFGAFGALKISVEWKPFKTNYQNQQDSFDKIHNKLLQKYTLLKKEHINLESRHVKFCNDIETEHEQLHTEYDSNYQQLIDAHEALKEQHENYVKIHEELNAKGEGETEDAHKKYLAEKRIKTREYANYTK